MSIQSNITRTIYASALQGTMVLGIPYDIPANTTLNEKFNIHPDAVVPVDEYPTVKYMGIGRGGHRAITGSDNSALTGLNVHRASDAALFTHIPYILRTLDDDLAVSERAKYGLRTIETHNGIDYIAYYLRRMNHNELAPQLQRVTVTDGETTSLPYVPSSTDLNPTPMIVAPVEVNSSNGEYLTASVLIQFELTTNDIAEIKAACVIIYGDALYATLSELCLCSGFDKVVTTADLDGNDFH